MEMSATQPPRRIAFSFPAHPGSIADVRHLVVGEARTLPFTEQDIDDIALAISEAFTNLVQHAQGYRIRGVCEVTPQQLEVRFEVDHSLHGHMGKTQLPTGLSRSGRGIPLLHMLIPSVEVHHSGNGMLELRLVKPVHVEKEHS